MRDIGFIVFLTVALAVYGLSNIYLIKRLGRALPPSGFWRTFILVFAIACAAGFIGGRIVIGRHPGLAGEIALIIGYVYLALWNVSLWLTLFYDFLRLIDKPLRFFPAVLRNDAAAGGGVAFRYILGTAAVICLFGAWNAARPRIRTETIDIAKTAGDLRELKIAVASDFHLSPVLRGRFLDRVLSKIRAFEPDLVLLPGDIAGEDVPAGDRDRITASFRALQPKFGVFACTGNHEYFGDLERNLETLRRGGVRFLQDEAELVGGAFYVVGRKDRMTLRMGGAREPLKTLVGGLDAAKPRIVLDHQPINLAEAAEAGVDLLLSGHTHNGQMFPISLINHFIYENNHGLIRKGDTWIDVTSGAGTWGPPVRIGTVAEVVHITVRFKSPV